MQIGHSVRLGRDVLLAAQVGISGSTTLEDRVTLGGQVGVQGHIAIGSGAIAAGQSGVTNSVEPGRFVTGYPGHRQPGLAQGVGGLRAAARAPRAA